MKQWYSFYHEQLPKSHQLGGQLSKEKSQRPVDQLEMPQTFGLIPWKHHVEEGELEYDSTVKDYLTVHQEGKRQVKRAISYYNLDVIISVDWMKLQFIPFWNILRLMVKRTKPDFTI